MSKALRDQDDKTAQLPLSFGVVSFGSSAELVCRCAQHESPIYSAVDKTKLYGDKTLNHNKAFIVALAELRAVAKTHHQLIKVCSQKRKRRS